MGALLLYNIEKDNGEEHDLIHETGMLLRR